MHNHRWTSRKFLISLSVQVTAIAVLLWPQHESAIVEAGRSITALVVMLLSGLGYVTAEASLDRRQPSSSDSEQQRPEAGRQDAPTS